MNNFSYLLAPFFAWLLAGALKFIINSIKAKKFAFGLVGYGGFPSNHTAIVTSTAAFIALENGIHSPAFGVAATLAFIVMLDANALRRQIGKQAEAINQLNNNKKLRERMGHTVFEIFGGLCVGVAVAAIIWAIQ